MICELFADFADFADWLRTELTRSGAPVARSADTDTDTDTDAAPHRTAPHRTAPHRAEDSGCSGSPEGRSTSLRDGPTAHPSPHPAAAGGGRLCAERPGVWTSAAAPWLATGALVVPSGDGGRCGS